MGENIDDVDMANALDDINLRIMSLEFQVCKLETVISQLSEDICTLKEDKK